MYIYKNRKLRPRERVRIYRNLNRGPGWYSVMQKAAAGWLVVGHTQYLTLVDCKFIVLPGGAKRFRKTGRKTVHAFIEGKVSARGAMGGVAEEGKLPACITYNPERDVSFVCNNLTADAIPVYSARAVYLRPDGVWGAYLN